MDRGKEIYDRIILDGMNAIKGFIADRASEELFIDFKVSRDYGKSGRLSDDDRNNLAKAISGFSNSAGGVIIWGVDCRNIPETGDVAQMLKPIDNPQKFKSLIEGAISGSTQPPNGGVVNQVIFDEGKIKKGYVVTYIPKSDLPPHQSLRHKKYYIRAGSDFVPTPHEVLAGMFGKRPNAHVMPQYVANYVKTSSGIELQIGVMILNAGPGVATDVFASISIELHPADIGEVCQVRLDFPNKENMDIWGQFGFIHNIICKPEFRMPPDLRIIPFEIKLLLVPPFHRPFKISGKIGANNAKGYRYSIEILESGLTKLQEKISEFEMSGKTIKSFDLNELIEECLNMDYQVI